VTEDLNAEIPKLGRCGVGDLDGCTAPSIAANTNLSIPAPTLFLLYGETFLS